MKEVIKRFVSTALNEVLFYTLSIKARMSKKADSKTVYILRFAHIGDFCVWLDCAKEFRKLYPDRTIVFLTYAYKNITELAEATGYFDKVISFQTEGFQRISALRKACGFCGDVVINANPSRSVLSDLFALALQVNQRIAQKSDLLEMTETRLRRSDCIYDRVIPCDLQEMELIKNAQFLRGLGDTEFRADLFKLPIVPCRVEMPDGQYAVLFPDADAPIQMWDYENYVTIIRYILEHYSMKCVLLGGGRYIHVGEQIMDGIRDDRCINMMGKTSLPECITLVRSAELVVSNDTGGAHIAAGTGTPCIVLAAGWNRGRFFPYKVEVNQGGIRLPMDLVSDEPCLGCGLETIDRFNPGCGIHGVPRCIANVSAEQVIEKINLVLGEGL